MRTAGIAEEFCTGDATDREKFAKYAELMPKALRNPLYHWTHLELKKYFGITTLLAPKTSDEIWENCGVEIAKEHFTARGLMKMSNVEVVCTTDDPTDSLEYHVQILNDESFDIQVRPTWRPDKAWMVDQLEVYLPWVEKLSAVAGAAIETFSQFLEALKNRHDFFHSVGCRLSDRGFDFVPTEMCSEGEASEIFRQALSGERLPQKSVLQFKLFMLHFFAVLDAEKGWTMQIHYGVLRSNNTRLAKQAGADIGCDSIGDWSTGEGLSLFLDRLDQIQKLPKTIIYPINPRDNEMIATMIGNFQDGITPGKIQFGSGWWFLDQLDGMTKQIEALSQLGLLSQFIGMLTDSRSFLSYTRHEYFRRLLCQILGNDMKRGLIPNDMELVGAMVQDICYNNAKSYFGFYS
jgi:glucuronate isomerase